MTHTAESGEPVRCHWTGIADPLYARYHDEEWGVPHADDQRLFEKLVLEGFQAGLSWLTILKRRDNFRAAFDGFDAERIARYGARDVERLMADASIIRNKLKIEGAIESAKAYLRVRERGSFAGFLWRHVERRAEEKGCREHRELPAQTEGSVRLSKELKVAGFRFVGPTTVYAYMQSIGMVNDHLVSCHRHAPCAKLQSKFTPPLS